MQQLPGIFVYFCAAVFVPIAIARFAVRADWRTVGYAALIWYGFLLLATGGFQSQEALGWVFILAMFLSIPALPVIALILKGWGWLGQRTVGTATAVPYLRWWQRLRLSILSPTQWSLLALLAAGYFAATYWHEQRELNARTEVLRQLLALPAGMKFTDVQSLKSSIIAPRIAATVRFTEAQFQAFAAQLDDAPRWQHGPPSYDGAPVEIMAPETIRWRDLPLSVHVGDRYVNWTKLSATAVQNLRRGRAVCIALQFKPDVGRRAKSGNTPRYAARDCSEPAKTDRVSVIVVGALDFDTRTLHMLIN